MFTMGGVDIFLHKYLGPKNPSVGTADQPIYATLNVTNIQDLLFLENRDRVYEPEIYKLRGFYKTSDIDFNLSMFGLFVDNDTLFLTVHINDFVTTIGRKPISGDVFEFPNLRDDFALSDFDISMPRYYVIEDVGRASEGFSVTWYPHLYRLKLKKITDNQQFSDILDKPASDDSQFTLRDLLSTHAKDLQINDQVLAQAEIDAPMSGYETRQFYTLAVDPTNGKPILETTVAGVVNARPVRTGYTGYLVGDGYPVNGYDFGHGIQFPFNSIKHDFYLRTDFIPNRLFQFDGSRWIVIEDAVRMTLSNTDTRQTLKGGFINNTKYTYTDVINTDMISLLEDAFIIQTTINYVTAPFVVIKHSTVRLDFALADHPTLVGSTLVNGVAKVSIRLPIVNGTQQVIPHAAVWEVTLCNHREAERQSLSKALKPKADL